MDDQFEVKEANITTYNENIKESTFWIGEIAK